MSLQPGSFSQPAHQTSLGPIGNETARGVELVLQPDEAALLERILNNYLSDLHMEITHTDSYDMRQALKDDRALARQLLARLQQLRAGVAPEGVGR
ncbi:MAG: hypothetical protein HY332_21570 [Chloroflexi bacterium]|nr:hypothetical protein [Chloroflexota bacterium]